MENTWYKTEGGKIEPVEVVRHTSTFVILAYCGGTFQAQKFTPRVKYFPTWEAARDQLLTEAVERVAGLAQLMLTAEGAMMAIEAMTTPSAQ